MKTKTGQLAKETIWDRDQILDLHRLAPDTVVRFSVGHQVQAMTVAELLKIVVAERAASAGGTTRQASAGRRKKAPGSAKKASGMHLRYLRYALTEGRSEEVVQRVQEILKVQTWEWLASRLEQSQQVRVQSLLSGKPNLKHLDAPSGDEEKGEDEDPENWIELPTSA